MKRTKRSRTNSGISQKELEEAFAQCDETGSGFVPITKLKFIMRTLGFEPRQKEVDALTSIMLKNEAARSVNKDAFSMEELAYVLEEKTGVNDVNDEISSTFKLFDANSKGYIDFEDLKRISVELGENLKDEEIREMIMEANPSKPGRLSKGDFEKVMRKTALY